MANPAQLKKAFSAIHVVRAPRHRLATFGDTAINYLLVTDVPGFPDRSRLRTGLVRADKPAIITPGDFKDRFEGFGEDGTKISDFLLSRYGQALAALEYKFKNEPAGSRVELTAPDGLIKKLAAKMDEEKPVRSALLRSSDKFWQISVMKFIVEETLSSFSTNARELYERGFFEGEDRELKRREREIEALLLRCAKDRALIPELGRKLKAYQLFEKYQDQFFQLVK